MKYLNKEVFILKKSKEKLYIETDGELSEEMIKYKQALKDGKIDEPPVFNSN